MRAVCQAPVVAVLGVDGWRGRWVGALLDGRSVRLVALADARAVLALRGVEVIGIDMPIGLPDNESRRCDDEARRRLRGLGAGSSVFPTPVRAVLATDDYAEARALSRAVTDPPRAPSAQAFQLVKAIRSLDDALGDPPAGHVHEVHPELAFRTLDPRVRDPKGTARGTAQRLAALRAVMDVEEALLDAPPRVPAVDALDACAAAWSAGRIAEGTASSAGGDERDARGRPMRISW
jgi:predicted RNase H-like nuclease